MDDVLAKLRDYLARSFPGAVVEVHDRSLAVRKEDLLYSIEVGPDVASEDLADLLEGQLYGELCRAEGLPLVLTSRGIRLKSAN